MTYTPEAIEQDTDRFYGKYRGLVADSDDPQNLGRIKATVPEVLDDVQTGWALPCAPYAGPDAGFFTVPPTGAGVWIEFEGGDTSRPIWSGSWWGREEVPSDEQGTRAQQPLKILRSERGMLVALDDSAQTITLSDANARNLVTIKVTEGTIDVRSSVKVMLEAPLIHHGEGASHPQVFGDQLLVYLNQLVALFNTHVHPGELAAGFIPVVPAPPVSPFPPATPDLLSVKNFNE
ncbi:MAG: phage baseplate assembly protein V [Gemmatimonadota bacterium]